MQGTIRPSLRAGPFGVGWTLVAATASTGPIVLGGDDLTDHGPRDAAGTTLFNGLFIRWRKRMLKHALAAALAVGLLAPATTANLTVFHDFGSYDAAVDSLHTLFIDFETDLSGNAVLPSEDIDNNDLPDIEGDVFSLDVVYSSPDFPSSRVNIGDIEGVIDNEIGPFNVWDGTLRWDYTAKYFATGFTGVEVEPTSVLRIYNGGILVDQVALGGSGGVFQFFGFTSTLPFDRVELDGLFFAIDAHYSTVITGAPDCNKNGIPDDEDIADGTSQDCNGNDVPDECDIDDGTSQDCNNNGVPDECDIASGTSADLDGNGIPDECEGDADFEDPQEVEAAGNPNIEAVGDLDGDGDSDIVIAIPGIDPMTNGVVQVFINQGNDEAGDWIGFVANDPVIVGREPSGVAVGLFDADLHLDVAVTNAGDNTLLILYNKGFGDGSLFDPVAIEVGNRPSAVVAADFNLDTFVDLAVTNKLDSNVMLILNADFPPPPPLGGGGGAAAAGGFSTFPTGGNGFSLISDDFDGNKRPDMAGTARTAGFTGQTGVVFVLLGLGDGTFEPVALYNVGSNPLDLSSADLQRDGAVDIVAVNTDDGTVSILINQLDGTFVAASPLAVGGTPVSIEVVELSGDSDPDLAVVAIDPEIGPAVQVLQNALGLGTELVFEDPIPFSVDADPNFVLSVDLNDDGAADLVTVNADEGETGGSVTALLGDPRPIAFRARLDIRPGGCPNPLNRTSSGVLPVALLGSADFDVSQVDLSTVRLERAAGIGSSVAPLQGPPGPSSRIEDVATPFDGEPCDCHDLIGDGTVDLSMKFGLAEAVEQLELNLLSGGDVVELVLSGLLLDETPFAASDCIRIVPAPDIDGDGAVGAADLLLLLGSWGPCTPAQECPADLDQDGNVSISDLITLLANWG